MKLILFVTFCAFLFGHVDEEKFFRTECPAKEIAFVQLSFDGINAFHCGVGAVVLQTQAVLKEFNEHYRNLVHFKLYLLAGDYSPSLPEYSWETLETNRKSCQETGGDVYLIPTTVPEEMFGHPTQWRELCQGGAERCAEIINQNSFTLIIAHDSAYAQLPLYLKKLDHQEKLKKPYRIVWVPHATSWTYNGHSPEGIAQWPERHAWELTAAQGASHYHYRIGSISQTIRQDLSSPPFCVPESSFLSYQTGILRDRYLQPLSEEAIASELEKRAIPLDKRLIFSIGRATPLKGHDITLEMFRHLRPLYPDIHLVMLAPPSDYSFSYFHFLKKRVEPEEGITFLEEFDPDLAHFIYQWPKTALVSLLSRMDTQPLTVMEARTNPQNSLVLVSNPERMGKQVVDGVDGFVCSLDGLDAVIDQSLPLTGPIANVVHSAQRILDLKDPLERQKVIEAGKQLISDRYDMRKNMIENLRALFGQMDDCEELSAHSERVCREFNLKGPLHFEKLAGGMVNPPVAVYSEKKNLLGLLKIEKGERAVQRLKVLSEIDVEKFPHLPTFFRNREGNHLTQIGKHFYSFSEFLAPDPSAVPTFEQMVEMTGKLHKETASLQSDFLQISKLEEYRTRFTLFSDPWFKNYNLKIFTGPLWDKVVHLSRYFASPLFRNLYDQLPKQLIHGDNNQTNVVIHNQHLYFIDFDALRIDVRLLDLVSYFRYGGFERYLDLSSQKKLIPLLQERYGLLTATEEQSIPQFVLFTHIEFMSWALKMLKEAVLDGNQTKEEEFGLCLKQYLEQLRRIIGDQHEIF